jgi:hypothetical protein
MTEPVPDTLAPQCTPPLFGRRYWTPVLDTHSTYPASTGRWQRRYWTPTQPTAPALDAGNGHPLLLDTHHCYWTPTELTPPIPLLLDTHSANTKSRYWKSLLDTQPAKVVTGHPTGQRRYWTPTPPTPPPPTLDAVPAPTQPTPSENARPAGTAPLLDTHSTYPADPANTAHPLHLPRRYWTSTRSTPPCTPAKRAARAPAANAVDTYSTYSALTGTLGCYWTPNRPRHWYLRDSGTARLLDAVTRQPLGQHDQCWTHSQPTPMVDAAILHTHCRPCWTPIHSATLWVTTAGRCR